MAFDMQDDSRCNETNRKKMSRHKKCSRERRLSHSSKQVKGTCPVESRSSNHSRCRPHFSDEEFIVFCFKEDGAFDVVKNGKPEAASSLDCTSRNSPRPVNRKVSDSVVYFLNMLNYKIKTKPPKKKKEKKVNLISGLLLFDQNSLIMARIQKELKGVAIRRG